jgi:hypothetical protein
MKYLKLYEELTFEPKKIYYTKDEGDSFIVYTFDFGDYTYLCEFSKIDNNMWRRDFHTMEEGFDTVNVSSKNTLDTYAYITQITEDFLNEYKPDLLVLFHTTESRFNVNWKFIQNINIDSDYEIKPLKNPPFNNDIKTVIVKKDLEDLIHTDIVKNEKDKK